MRNMTLLVLSGLQRPVAAQAVGGNSRIGEPVPDGEGLVSILNRDLLGSVCDGARIVEEVLREQ